MTEDTFRNRAAYAVAGGVVERLAIKGEEALSPSELDQLEVLGIRGNMRLSKEESRKRWRELRDTVNEWDPIGLIAMGAPQDEYECMVGPLMRMLEAGSGPEEIADYLNRHVPEHFGVSRTMGVEDFAQEIIRWFGTEWKDSTV